MFVVTTDEIPGYRITRAHGHVLGTIVRTLSLGAGLRPSAVRSEAARGRDHRLLAVAVENRQEAIKRMWADAEQRGANAVVGMRFDSNDLEGVAEVCAFGTAVTVEPI